jgi:hypothetical protein
VSTAEVADLQAAALLDPIRLDGAHFAYLAENNRYYIFTPDEALAAMGVVHSGAQNDPSACWPKLLPVTPAWCTPAMPFAAVWYDEFADRDERAPFARLEDARASGTDQIVTIDLSTGLELCV